MSVKVPIRLFRLPNLTQINVRTITSGLSCSSLSDALIPRAPYGGRHVVTMLPGDGIGPELMEYVKEIVKFMNAPIDFEVVEIKDGESLTEDLESAVISLRRNGCGLKGTIEPNLKNPLFRNPNVELRNNLDLFINVTHCKSLPGVRAKHKNADVIIIRQNTEGEYAMLEHECKTGVVESLKIITESNTTRLAKWAFEYAMLWDRKVITIVHKANIMKLSDGLFLRTVKEVGKSYPNIKCTDLIVDNCSMQILTNSSQFDVLIMPNLYGTIMNNVACGLTGGSGITSGSNFGYNCAIFEPACRTLGKAIAGQNRANPAAMLNATVSLLFHLKQNDCAKILKKAIVKTICEDKFLTPDVGGTHKSTEVVAKIKENIMHFNKIVT